MLSLILAVKPWTNTAWQRKHEAQFILKRRQLVKLVVYTDLASGRLFSLNSHEVSISNKLKQRDFQYFKENNTSRGLFNLQISGDFYLGRMTRGQIWKWKQGWSPLILVFVSRTAVKFRFVSIPLIMKVYLHKRAQLQTGYLSKGWLFKDIIHLQSVCIPYGSEVVHSFIGSLLVHVQLLTQRLQTPSDWTLLHPPRLWIRRLFTPHSY